jgi:hypothetical protein
MLEWKKRCVKDQTMAADRKIWETKCGRFRVIFSHIRYGGGALPDTYLAMRLEHIENLPEPSWSIISRHKKREKAMEACEKKSEEKPSRKRTSEK